MIKKKSLATKIWENFTPVGLCVVFWNLFIEFILLFCLIFKIYFIYDLFNVGQLIRFVIISDIILFTVIMYFTIKVSK